METIKFSNDQKKAIWTKSKNIIVSAQAGAGKTQVLVERIIANLRGLQLVDEGDLDSAVIARGKRSDIDKMLIVTFTNKAAQEMKDRIKKDLAKLISSNTSDLRFLSEQYNKVTNAQISTMHSFCINTVRTYFHKLGLNPNFAVLNQASIRIMKWDAMDKTFQEYYDAKDGEFFDFLFEYSDLKGDENVKNDLFSIYNFLMSQIDPLNWFDGVIDFYGDYEIDKADRDARASKYMELFQLVKDESYIYLEKCDKLLLEMKGLMNQPLAHEKYVDLIDQCDEYYTQIKRFVKNDEVEKLEELAETVKFDRLPRVTEKQIESGKYDRKVNEKLKVARNKFKDNINNMLSILVFDLDESLLAQEKIYKYLNTTKKILQNFHSKFMDKKRAANGIDFSDSEHLMVKLLEDDTVADDLRERFEYIYFDEYQDANQLQNHIIEKIKGEDNLFFVGDIKQSIYRFRLADPKIFKSRYDRYKSQGGDKDLAVDLSENYRSRKEVLDFSNMIFNQLMTDRLGEVNYDDPAHRLVAAGTFPNVENLVPIEINYVYSEHDEENDRESNGEKESKYIVGNLDKRLRDESNQPYLIAKKISKMIEEGSQAKDFGILVRNKAMIPDICDYLKLFNIPFYTDSIDFDYSRLEVLEFVNILKAIDNDKNDLVLLSTLFSVIGNFTEDEVAIIRSGDKDKSFYSSFYEYRNRRDSKEEIVEKIDDYINTLEDFRNVEKTMSLYDFTWYVLKDSGYESYLLTHVNGNLELDNVVAFIEEIKDYEQSARPGLYDYLNYVDRLSQRSLGDIEPGAKLSEKDNVVRIMTIHKSKGLQIKNVILADIQKQFNFRDLYGKYIYHNELGMALKTFDLEEDKHVPNLFFDRIARANKMETLSEEVRLLYVALTRAIDSIIIFASIKKSFFENLDDDYEFSRNFLTWISSIILRDESTNKFKLANGISYESHFSYMREHNMELSLNIFEKNEVYEEKVAFVSSERSSQVRAIEDEESDFEFLNFKYEYEDDTSYPYKKTVSQLSSFNDNKSSDYKNYQAVFNDSLELAGYDKPKFLIDEDMTSLEKGTLTHYILQILPAKAYDKDSLEEEFSKLIVKGLLRPEEKTVIDKETILQFYNSELGHRLFSSHKIRKEEAFTMKYNEAGKEILVDGQVDLYFIEDGAIVIIDFKTNKHINENLYKAQFDLYTMGLEKATGLKVKERYVYWTSFNKFTAI